MVCVSDSVMVHDEVKTLGDLQVYHLLHFLQQVQPVAARGSLAPGGADYHMVPPPTSCIRQSPLPFASGAVLHSDSVSLSGRSRGGGGGGGGGSGGIPPAKYGLYNYAAFN